ncbi:MAG: hypothetical protein BWK80_54785, partial [Desulfobacteraceae bacterium IS3]
MPGFYDTSDKASDMIDNSVSDTEIVRRVIDGDVNAFEHLLKKYKQYVFKIVGKRVPYDQTEEIAQEVFIRAYQSLPNFKGISAFQKWLARIAVRACCDFWRKAYKSKEFSMSSLTENQENLLEKIISDQSGQAFSERWSQKEAEEILNYALNRLSAKDRTVLELVYLEG